METVVRNVDDIDAQDRHALEHVLGKSLREDQQLVIRIINRQAPAEALPDAEDKARVLPEWCNVYAGLSEREWGFKGNDCHAAGPV